MKVHTNMWSFRKYSAFCGFVGLNSHHAPSPPRKSSAIQFFFQRQLSSLQQHYPDHRHYIDYSKSSLLIVNCAQTSCPSASCPPSGTSYLYPDQLRHQEADKDECKHCRTIAGKYRATNPKKLSLCLYFAGYKASEQAWRPAKTKKRNLPMQTKYEAMRKISFSKGFFYDMRFFKKVQ